MLKLPQSLTQTSVTACLSCLVAALPAEPAVVIVDAAALSQFDSAALALLLALQRETVKQGKTLAITDLPQRLADLSRLYGIAELLSAKVA